MDINQQLKILFHGVSEIINSDELKSRLEESIKTKTPLKVKAGFDPTAPDIHLGHAVLLRKLRQFQDLGHRVIFLIGDFTAQIGDPTGQKKLRPKLSSEEIRKNAATYETQVYKILDKRKTEVKFNSKWFNKMKSQEILRCACATTVNQVLARADFKERFEQKSEINLLEFMYPLLQAYDSVELKADVEVGGTDQKFNLLMGRQLQNYLKQRPQVVIMTPLLEGLDGVQKMSKSLGNHIGINDPPKDMFGKIMSISDEIMWKYYELLTDEDLEKVKGLHPKEAKLKLAQIIVGQFHDEKKAKFAQEEFDKVFKEKKIPEDILVYKFSASNKKVCDILLASGTTSSANEARRLLKEGAVSFNDKKINENWQIEEGILKVGKRRFLKLVRSK